MRLIALTLALAAAALAAPVGIAQAQTAAQEQHITGADETGNLRYGYTPGYSPYWGGPRAAYYGAYAWAPRDPYVRHGRYYYRRW